MIFFLNFASFHFFFPKGTYLHRCQTVHYFDKQAIYLTLGSAFSFLQPFGQLDDLHAQICLLPLDLQNRKKH